MNVLIATNMAPTPQEPSNGAFVRRQYQALKIAFGDQACFSFFDMRNANRISNKSLFRYLAFLGEFARKYVFSKRRIDIIHIHFFFPTILLAIIYKWFRNPKVKIVATFHGSDIYHYQPFNSIYKFCFNSIQHAIFVSEKLSQRMFKNSVESSFLCAGVSDVYKKSTSDKDVDFVFVGKLDKNKGVDRLIEFIGKLSVEQKVIVVGATTDETIKRFLNEHKQVEYYSHLDAPTLNRAYGRAKWLLSFSFNESFGLVMTEAMISGTPVLATRTDGSESQLVDGFNGFIFEQGDNCVEKILTKHKKISESAYLSIQANAVNASKKAQLSQVVESIFNIYKGL